MSVVRRSKPFVAPIDRQLGPLGRARVNIVASLLEMLFGDQRTHLGFGIGAGTDVQRAHLWSQDFDQALGSCLGDRDCYEIVKRRSSAES